MIIVTACLLALWLPDQTAVRYTATIAVPEAELRAGPSNDTKLYTTNKLRQGDTVVVVEERPDGWLAVRPPSGSFSWINARYLQQVTPTLPNWVVNAPAGTKVTVLVGSSSDTTVRPSVESASLQRGAQVRAIGTVVGNDDQKWLPVEPPESERRYMRREAIGTATVAHAPSPAAPAAVAAMTVGGSGALISNNPTGPKPFGCIRSSRKILATANRTWPPKQRTGRWHCVKGYATPVCELAHRSGHAFLFCQSPQGTTFN